jgi:hypothetical protein
MKSILLTALLCLSTLASAAERSAQLLTGNALVSDGDSHEILIVVPDVAITDSIKVKGKGLKVLQAEMVGPGLARVRVLPKAVDRSTLRSLSIRTTGATETQFKLEVEVLPGPAGLLRVLMDPPILPASSAEAQIRITFQGAHPMPASARGVRLQASSGTVSEPIRMEDGSFVARYTAPKNRKAEMVVISAADIHFPDHLLGAVVLPVREMRRITLDAETDAAHLIHYAGRTYGPFQPAGGKFSARMDLDPRFTSGRLEVSSASGKSTKSDLPLLDAGKASLHFFPLPQSLPQGGTLNVHILALGPKGQPDDKGSLLLGPHEMVPLGSGVYRHSKTAPEGETQWTLKAFMDEVGIQATIRLTAPLPKAPPLSRVQAIDRPVSNVLIWPTAPLISGQTGSLTAVAVDQWGLPIANTDLSLGVPAGDALLPTQAKTDRRGMAQLKIKVGADTNPVVVRIGAEGVDVEQAFPINAAQATFFPAGDAHAQDLYDAWWLLVPGGQVTRRAQYTAPEAVAGGPALQAVAEQAEKLAPTPPPAPENGIRWRFQLLDMGRLHVTMADKNSLFPESVRYNKQLPLGIFGVDSGFSWQFKAGLDLDVRAQLSLLNQKTQAEMQGGFPSDVQIGVVHRREVLGTTLYGGLWAQRFDALVSRHVTSAGGPVALIPVGVYAGRLGVGVEHFYQGIVANLELSESFSPWPVDFTLGSGLELPGNWIGLGEKLHLAVDFDYHYRQMTFALEGDEAQVLGGISALKIGVGGRL